MWHSKNSTVLLQQPWETRHCSSDSQLWELLNHKWHLQIWFLTRLTRFASFQALFQPSSFVLILCREICTNLCVHMCHHVSMGLENRVSNPMKPGFLDCILHSMSLSESESDFEIINPIWELGKTCKNPVWCNHHTEANAIQGSSAAFTTEPSYSWRPTKCSWSTLCLQPANSGDSLASLEKLKHNMPGQRQCEWLNDSMTEMASVLWNNFHLRNCRILLPKLPLLLWQMGFPKMATLVWNKLPRW